MRNLKTLAFAGLFGTLMLAGDASACHKKKCACPAPAPVACAPAPVVACAPAPKKCHMKMPKMKHHAKATCAPVAYAAAPVAYATQGYSSPQGYATPQSAPMGTMQAPPKSM